MIDAEDTALLADYEWVRQYLSRISYKDGFEFKATLGPYRGAFTDILVEVSFETNDAYNPGKRITVVSKNRVPDVFIGKLDRMNHWLQRVLFRIERHESQEWFRFDGIMVDDPHKGDKK